MDFGYFVRPAAETGDGLPRGEPCLGYLVDHADGMLLFDTGMGSNPDVDAHYRPRRQQLDDALVAAGARRDQIDLVANCHLHFDHCGGNPLLTGRPVFTQRIELDAARYTQEYTLPELIDTPGARYEELDGDAEVLPGVFLLPTAGHTAGHQSLERTTARWHGDCCRAEPRHGHGVQHRRACVARARDGHSRPLPVPPAWVNRLQELNPARVVFARDHSVWEP